MLSWPLGNWPVSETRQETAGAGVGGVVITPGGTPHVKTAWSTVITMTTFAADGFYMSMAPNDTTVCDYLFDVGWGYAGSEQVVVENVAFSSAGGDGGPTVVYIPIPIPAGQRVAARVQTNAAAAHSVQIIVSPVSGGAHRAMRCKVATTYGANLADSGATEIDPGGGANTKSAWVELARETQGFRFATIMFGGRANSAQTAQNRLWDLGYGLGGGEQVLIPDIRQRVKTEENLIPSTLAVYASIPAGSRLVARMQSSTTDATDRLGDISVIGFA